MADLSEYRIFEGVEFQEEVKTLMQIFADSWYECREEDCSRCKYRRGKERYTLMACLSERYAEKLIAADVALVRHGRWKYGTRAAICTNCGFERSLDDNFGRALSCPNCSALMDGGESDA